MNEMNEQPPNRRARRCILKIEMNQVGYAQVAWNCDSDAFPDFEGPARKSPAGVIGSLANSCPNAQIGQPV